jgi:hypothetical protein
MWCACSGVFYRFILTALWLTNHRMIISLHTLSLNAPLNLRGECLVLTELILPRNSIARKSVLKDVKLSIRGQDDGRVAQASYLRAPFYEKGLLKEKIDGPVGLKVSVTRPLKHPELSLFARRLFIAGLESTIDFLPSSDFGASLFGDLADEAVDQLEDRLLDEEHFVAAGGIDLDSETLLTGLVTIPLKLLQAYRSSCSVPLSQKREQRKAAAKTYRKGTQVGELTLHLQQD